LPLGELTADFRVLAGRRASETQDQRTATSLKVRSELDRADEKPAL